jgi:N,N-dimethylformamidase
MSRDSDLSLIGYADPWSARPGERVRVMVRDHGERTCRLDLVRLVGHGAPPASRTVEEEVPALQPVSFQGRRQPIHPGSCAVVPAAPFLDGLRSFTVELTIFPMALGRPQALLGTWSERSRDGFGIWLDARGAPSVRVGSSADGSPRLAECSTGVPLRNAAWVTITASYDGESGRLSIAQRPVPTRSPGFDLMHRAGSSETRAEPGLLAATGRDLLIAAWHDGPDGAPRGGHFDGRIEAPQLASRADASSPEAFESRWDFALGIDTDAVRDSGSAGLHGLTLNCPARAVTGSRWRGEEHSWTHAPEQWAAIHFHADDIADAGWEADAEVALPADLTSGIYALRVRSEDGDSGTRLPLFVRPPAGGERADVLFLVPTATYLAYANHRLHDTLAIPMFGSGNLPFQKYLREHPEVGPNTYGLHSDGTGCMYTSRLRPILNLQPEADGWAFSADLAITGFLEHCGIRWELATDEQLHAEGRALLERYRVVVTGSHPEYWSTPMLDALEAWQRSGGRLVYLGGNGFYWRVAFSESFPGVMEVRRVGPATRAWAAAPGEHHHSFTGELGGLWRDIGRAPNQIAGIGFAAQGVGGRPYARSAASHDPRAAWIFEGVKSEDAFGDFGRLGGAADEEIDRFDPALGSPPHALVVASSSDHGRGMLRVIEEYLITLPPMPDPDVRADLLFYETPGGGAVLSTGSIGWIAALSHDDYDNDVARITANVLRRFADPAPFATPEGAADARPERPWFCWPDPRQLLPLLESED